MTEWMLLVAQAITENRWAIIFLALWNCILTLLITTKLFKK